MIYLIGETFRDEVYTYDPLSGDLAVADSISGVLVVNGTDTGVTVTISTPSTGVYKVSCSLTGRSNGDVCYVRITVTVDGVTEKKRLEMFRVDQTVSALISGFTNGTAFLADVRYVNNFENGDVMADMIANYGGDMLAIKNKTNLIPASPAQQGTLTSVQTEVGKIPRLGSTYKHRNIDTGASADVIIEAAS